MWQWQKWLPSQDDLPQLRHVLSALLRQLYITAELGAADRDSQ